MIPNFIKWMKKNLSNSYFVFCGIALAFGASIATRGVKPDMVSFVLNFTVTTLVGYILVSLATAIVYTLVAKTRYGEKFRL